MAVTPIKVNFQNIFSNGTLTVTSAGTTWNDKDRIADGFINRIAMTAGTPTGETIVKVDQGGDPSKYFGGNRFIIDAKHNIALSTVLNLETSTDDIVWVSVTNPALDDAIAPGVIILGTFDKIAGGGLGQRYWRLRFTQTNEPLEIPELWVGERIELGASDTVEDGNAIAPMDFPLRPNFVVTRTLEGIRSAIERGITLRAMTVQGEALSPTAFADWEAFLTGAKNGLNNFYMEDPRGATWFAEVLSIDTRELDSPERWTITLQIQEVP